MQVNSEKSFPELFNHCSQHGEIKEAQHYSIANNELHYILLEYLNSEQAENALKASRFNDDISGVPAISPFLWFRAGQQGKPKLKHNPNTNPLTLVTENGTEIISEKELTEILESAPSLKDQMTILHRTTCLNDLGTRLRFLAAKQIERSMSGIFPKARALLFGSSVNGFGKMGCDLDMILRMWPDKKSGDYSRLIFHTKENLSNGRSQTQRQMETVGDILQQFLPGVDHVRRILQARVPIIKYHHVHLDLEVDLSMSNMTGFYMSELLFMFGEIDERVRPLVFCIRKWAQSVGLTNPSPGRWISNFSLTALVIFFLQQLKQPVLPPINLLIEQATNEDVRITEDDINCTFMRDLNQLQFSTKNVDNVDNLLMQFFEFFAQFDFHSKAISLNEGRTIPKPEHTAMYIVNPLEQILNVSKNVSFEETERFRIEVRNAAWILESDTNRLLNLFKTNQKTLIRPQMFFKPRMVDVSELFNGDTQPPSDSGNDGTKYEHSKNVEFKSNLVKHQVNAIKTQAKLDLKQIKGFTSRGKR